MKNRFLKITDIFSYVSPKELSLDELESIFRHYESGDPIFPYSILLDDSAPALDAEKLSACRELHMDGKAVAYVVYEGNVIALIAYLP